MLKIKSSIKALTFALLFALFSMILANQKVHAVTTAEVSTYCDKEDRILKVTEFIPIENTKPWAEIMTSDGSKVVKVDLSADNLTKIGSFGITYYSQSGLFKATPGTEYIVTMRSFTPENLIDTAITQPRITIPSDACKVENPADPILVTPTTPSSTTITPQVLSASTNTPNISTAILAETGVNTTLKMTIGTLIVISPLLILITRKNKNQYAPVLEKLTRI